MAVSVRMDPLLEKELEQAARRQGVSKSQFIIAAVERALGRKDPAQLYQQVMGKAEEAAQPRFTDAAHARGSDEGMATDAANSTSIRLREKLRARHQAQSRDWQAYQEARKRGVAWVPDDEEGAA
ncbi:hypothetical protein GCM10027019_31470 [Melaminivora jejuensis]